MKFEPEYTPHGEFFQAEIILSDTEAEEITNLLIGAFAWFTNDLYIGLDALISKINYPGWNFFEEIELDLLLDVLLEANHAGFGLVELLQDKEYVEYSGECERPYGW